ncbi:MarC family protein [Hafnia alvei]|uniref:MarC family protein n=1 Tax=Hafnia alvei TaxID=569 RepID=UPI0024A81FA3|nr:MarC family protein [Hafnia alvei]
MLSPYFHSLSSLLVIINPLTMFSLFISYTAHMTSGDILSIGKKTTLAVAITLLVFVWFGMHIFSIFGINMAALKLAGGLSLLIGSLNGLNSNVDSSDKLKNIAIVPLCFPIIAGPAAISIVISMTTETGSRTAVSFASLTIALILGVMFHFAEPICQWLGETTMNIIKKVSYLVLACIGVKLMMAGFIFYFR